MNTKQLRQQILSLAIEGKLVPQLPEEGTAEELLAQIRKEKEQLVKDGKLKKKDLDVAPIQDDEIPFDIPASWRWVRLNQLASYKKGPFGSELTKSMFVTKSKDTYKVYEQQHAIKKNIELGSYYITKEKFNSLKGFEVKPGDIIVSCAGTIGETFKIPQNSPAGIINQALMMIKLYYTDIEKYYLLYFDFILKKQAKEDGNGTAMKNIPPFAQLKKYLIPLPPLAEQKRIVAKLEAILGELDNVEKQKQKISLYADQLKKQLLQEAIQGRLVPQIAEEGTAEELLAQIRKEKEQLVKDGKLKKKDLEVAPIQDDEIPFEIPASWQWVRLGTLAKEMADGPFGSNLKNEHYTKEKEARIIQLSNIGENGWREENIRYTTFQHATTNISRSIVNAGDLVIAKMMPAGRTIICPNHEKMFVLSSDSIKLALLNGIDKAYIRTILNSPIYRKNISGETRGIGRERTSITKLKSLVVPLPPLAEQKRIVAKVEELFTEIENLK